MVRFRSDEIGRLLDAGHRVESDIEHDYRVIEIDSDSALVADVYKDRSVLVDAETRAPVDDEPTEEEVAFRFEMSRIGDRWLVMHVVRYHFSD